MRIAMAFKTKSRYALAASCIAAALAVTSAFTSNGKRETLSELLC